MKKSLLLALATAVILSSCGTLANLGPSSDGQRFQDGIYGKAPSFKTKTDRDAELAESQSLVDKTKGSTIYLFGDKKDTVYVPKEMAARISFSNELGTTVTVTDYDYDWRYDNTWAWYTPYSIGSSWYWSRHYNPWYSSAWAFSPWHYRGFYDPWYYGGFYSSWYFGGFYDPWYYGGFYDPWYYGGVYWPHYHGWYGGWDPFWPGHHPGYHPIPDHHSKDVWRGPRYQTGSDRVFASRTSSRGGLGSSPTSRREVVASSAKSVSRASATGSTTARRTAVRTAPSTRTTTAVRGTAGQSNVTVSTGTATQTPRSNYRRPASTTANRSGVSSTTRSSVSGSSPTGSTRSNSGFSTGTTTRSSSFSTGTPTRSSSSYSGGGYSGGSRSSSGGGYSGGGASRSGGSSGGRR